MWPADTAVDVEVDPPETVRMDLGNDPRLDRFKGSNRRFRIGIQKQRYDPLVESGGQIDLDA